MLLYAGSLQHSSLWCSFHCCPSLKSFPLIPIKQVIMHFNNLTELKKNVSVSVIDISFDLIQNGGLIATMINSTENDSWEHQNTTSLIIS